MNENVKKPNAGLVLLGLVLLLGLAIWLSSPNQQRTSTPPVTQSTPQPEATPERTPAYNLALIDGRSSDREEYQRFLMRLDDRYPENETQISDIVANVYEMFRKNGVGVNRDKNCMAILRDLDDLPRPSEQDKLGDLATLYALAGTDGKGNQ